MRYESEQTGASFISLCICRMRSNLLGILKRIRRHLIGFNLKRTFHHKYWIGARRASRHWELGGNNVQEFQPIFGQFE